MNKLTIYAAAGGVDALAVVIFIVIGMLMEYRRYRTRASQMPPCRLRFR